MDEIRKIDLLNLEVPIEILTNISCEVSCIFEQLV